MADTNTNNEPQDCCFDFVVMKMCEGAFTPQAEALLDKFMDDMKALGLDGGIGDPPKRPHV